MRFAIGTLLGFALTAAVVFAWSYLEGRPISYCVRRSVVGGVIGGFLSPAFLDGGTAIMVAASYTGASITLVVICVLLPDSVPGYYGFFLGAATVMTAGFMASVAAELAEAALEKREKA